MTLYTLIPCRFEGNVSPSTAGGLQITFLQEGRAGRHHQILVEDCTFTSNQASYGGAVFFLPLSEYPDSMSERNHFHGDILSQLCVDWLSIHILP